MSDQDETTATGRSEEEDAEGMPDPGIVGENPHQLDDGLDTRGPHHIPGFPPIAPENLVLAKDDYDRYEEAKYQLLRNPRWRNGDGAPR